MKHSPIVTFLKGLIVGGTMLVPGVSGGSMAIVLGIYDKLIHAVSALTRLDKASFFFLCAFSAGGGLGIIDISPSPSRCFTSWKRIPSPRHTSSWAP